MKYVTLFICIFALSACKPAPSDHTETRTQEVILKKPQVMPVKTLSTKITNVAYTGRVDVMGETSSAYNLSSTLTDKLRSVTATSELMTAIHNEFKEAWRDKGLKVPERFSTFSQIIGISEAFPAHEGGLVLHEGLVSVEDGAGIYGVTSNLEWDDEKKIYKIVIKPWGFTATNITVLTRTNIRENPRFTEATPMLGVMIGDEFHITNTAGTDGAFHYTLIKVQNRTNGEDIIFYGPDNFQTYR